MRFYAFERISSRGQKDRYGPLTQHRDLDKFCETWPDGPHEIIHTEPVIESATRWERPLWEQAIGQGIAAYREGIIDAFLFPRVDRESRNPFASVPIIKKALDAGIKCFFAQDRLCLDPKNWDSVEEYVREINEAMAYISRLKKLTIPGRISRGRDDQKHPTNTRMFGFTFVDGKRIVNEAQAEAIRQAAAIALKTGRVGEAARWLNSQGWRGVHGKLFSRATLGNKKGLFRNRALIGETTIHFKQEPEPIIIRHDSILDNDTFDQLQRLLDERRLRAPRSKVFYVLTGLVYCGCGARFEPTKIGPYRYYRCKLNCGEKGYRKDKLESELYEAFSFYLMREQQLGDYIQSASESREKIKVKLQDVERNLTHNTGEWRTLLDKELAGYPHIIIQEKKSELTIERDSLLSARANLEKQLAIVPETDPENVKLALSEIRRAWIIALERRYIRYDPEFKMNFDDCSQALEGDPARLLREMLIKLNCRITVKNHKVLMNGELPLSVRAKANAS